MKGQSGNGTERFINFKVEMRPGDGGTTPGSTTGDDIVHTYEGDIKVISDARFAAHLAHEYCHAIGFRHSDKKKCDNLRDCYSVPYAIGNMVEIILTGINRDKCAYPEI